MEDLEVYNSKTGEIFDFEKVVQDYMRINRMSVIKGKPRLSEILKNLENNTEDLSLEEIVRVAKKFKVPINSFYSFYMVSLSPYYMDLNISKGTTSVFNKLLKMVVNGHIVDSFNNNKPIENTKSLYVSIGISKDTFYRAKKELEDIRLIKYLDSGDNIIILFNPTYVRCGTMDELTFFEFENEIKKYNYIEWMYFKRKYNNSGFLKLKKI